MNKRSTETSFRVTKKRAVPGGNFLCLCSSVPGCIYKPVISNILRKQILILFSVKQCRILYTPQIKEEVLDMNCFIDCNSSYHMNNKQLFHNSKLNVNLPDIPNIRNEFSAFTAIHIDLLIIENEIR
jgi:hypothetical protein